MPCVDPVLPAAPSSRVCVVEKKNDLARMRDSRLTSLQQEHIEGVPMIKKSVVLVLAFATAALCAAPAAIAQDAKTVLSNASKAMGADDLKTVQYSGTASEFSFGQAVNPASPWPGFADQSYTRTIN